MTSKSLTKKELINTLKDLDIATKNDILASEKRMKAKMSEDILVSERRMKLRMGQIKNDLAGRIANVALSSPTTKQFENLKRKVEGKYSN